METRPGFERKRFHILWAARSKIYFLTRDRWGSLAKRGQPPKEPEDKRKSMKLMFSPKEKELIAQGWAAEETDEKFSTYVRNAALQRAEKALEKKKDDLSRLDTLEKRIEELERMILK